jgi:hypothetical protein
MTSMYVTCHAGLYASVIRQSLMISLLSHGIWDKIHASIDAELAVYNIQLDYDLFITKEYLDTLSRGVLRQFSPCSLLYTESS